LSATEETPTWDYKGLYNIPVYKDFGETDIHLFYTNLHKIHGIRQWHFSMQHFKSSTRNKNIMLWKSKLWIPSVPLLQFPHSRITLFSDPAMSFLHACSSS